MINMAVEGKNVIVGATVFHAMQAEKATDDTG
jgi:hypothetical protein